MARTKIHHTQLSGIPDGNRDIVQYKNSTSVFVRGKQAHMGGFRFHGNYYKNGPVFDYSSTPATCDTSTDLAFSMSSVVFENWYAVFAVANDGDATCTLKAVPFLRADSVASSVITLRKAGEQVHSSSPQTYTWQTSTLVGQEILVINETVDGRVNNFSGRTTTITAATTTTITLDDIGNVATGDFLLPAPDGYDNYRYCCAFYVDTSEVRNISDSGSLVTSRGVFDNVSATNTGEVATAEKRDVTGYISPLATGVMLNSTYTISTTGTGSYAEDYDLDSSNHTVLSIFETKGDIGGDIRNYLLSGRLFSGNPDIAISSNFDVATTNECHVSINSTIYTVSASEVCDTGTTANFPAGKWGVVVVNSDTSGNLTSTWYTNSGAGYDTEALAAAARDGVEVNKAPIGYVTVQADAGATWTAGTDALAGGTGGTPAQTTNYYNSSNAANELTSGSVQTFTSNSQIMIPFAFGQNYYYKNYGDLDTARTGGQQNIWGWIEP